MKRKYSCTLAWVETMSMLEILLQVTNGPQLFINAVKGCCMWVVTEAYRNLQEDTQCLEAQGAKCDYFPLGQQICPLHT